MADAPARVRIGRLDQLGDGVHPVADDVRRDPFGDRDHPATHDEEAVVTADEVALHDDPAATGLVLGDLEGPGQRSIVAQVQANAAAVVAVERLDHHGKADPVGHLDRAVQCAYRLGRGDREAGGSEQLERHLLVAGDVDRQRARLRRHRRPDPLGVDALPELHEGAGVQPHPRNVARRRLIDE